MHNITTGGNSLLDAGIIMTKAGVAQGMTVADLGCGSSGHFVFPAAEIVGLQGKVYAVDIMKTALESISKRKRQDDYANIEAVWTNLEVFNATKIESGSLDVALLINTLYQSHKRVEILRETVRMLKKSGILAVVDWKNVTLPFGPPVSERVNRENLINGAPKLGLEFQEEFFVGQFHYGLIFMKI